MTGLRRFRMRAGPTTRTTQLRSGERVTFAREALEQVVRDVGTRFLPFNVEHLGYLPPIGKVDRASVEIATDGHAELYFETIELPQGSTDDFSLRDEVGDDLEPADQTYTARLGMDRRNFDPVTWGELGGTSPFPLDDTPRWSSLSPLIWVLAVPVTWGSAKFAGAFLERIGLASADRLASWISSASAKARLPDRESLVEVRFDTEAGMVVSGFVPLDINSSSALANLKDSLNALGPLAQFAGGVAAGEVQDLQLAAFIYYDDKWNLAWWAAPDYIYISPWLMRNCPDPQRFLGRPLLTAPEESTSVARPMPGRATPPARRRKNGRRSPS